MLGVTVTAGIEPAGAALAPPMSRSRGMQLPGSCRPGARRLRRGYQLVLGLIVR